MLFEMILFVVTSHGQENNVCNQFTSISNSFAHIRQKFTYLCIESSDINHSSMIDINKEDSSLADFSLLRTEVSNFWCGSVFAAISFLSNEFTGLSDYTRVVLMNSDVILEDWTKILFQQGLLESFVTCSTEHHKVSRSGFNQIVPFAPLHNYPHCGKSLSNSKPFYCEVVPTRCVIMPHSALLRLRSIYWLPKLLPHYGADFIVTKYLSFKLGVKWLVRNDSFLVEDLSSTGIKPFNSSSLIHRLSSINNPKSIFNWRLLFLYPIIYCILFLPLYYWPLYLPSYWLKFFVSLFALKK